MIPVQLHLKEPFYTEYMLMAFKSKKNPDKIIVSGNTNLGKFIQTHVQFSDYPKQSWGPSTTTIYIHLSEFKKENKFIYFDEFTTDLINKQIDIALDNDFIQFCLTSQRAGIKIKDSITMFIRVMNLRMSDDLFDRFKKRDYRRRKKIDELITSAMKLNLKELYLDD